MSGLGSSRPVAYRFEVWLADLEPVVGSEIVKTRPVVVLSPNDFNDLLRTILIAPMTSAHKHYPSRINLIFQDRTGQLALDQMRSIDRLRLIRKLGQLTSVQAKNVLKVLH